jgi:nucleoside-diphosphate-sugar epimerase
MWSVGLDAASRGARRQVWIDGLQRVLEALPPSDHPSRLIYCSSTSVYGKSLEDVDEDTPPSPRGEGGEVCLQAEELTREFGMRTGCAVTILRLAGLYGPDRLLRKLDDLRNQVPIEADPEHWLNLIHVDDAAAIVEAVSRLSAPPPLINVVSPRPVTRGEYYRTLAELAGTPEPLFQPPTGTDATSRRGNANRRIVSRVLPALQVPTKFDSLRAGLAQALKED